MSIKEDKTKGQESKKRDTCFVIMPIGRCDEYSDEHFLKVYRQIFCPAIEKAGFTPHRVDQDNSSHHIKESIIRQLIEAPLVLCDLSTHNPNVLYELGMRHAFDKPVVLVQALGTQRIFDISGINTIDYRDGRIYDEVIEDQGTIAKAIEATMNTSNGTSVSVMKKILVTAAELPLEPSTDEKTDIVLGSMGEDIRFIKRELSRLHRKSNFTQSDRDRLDDLRATNFPQIKGPVGEQSIEELIRLHEQLRKVLNDRNALYTEHQRARRLIRMVEEELQNKRQSSLFDFIENE